MSGFLRAARCNDAEALERLLAGRADIEEPNGEGMTPLQVALMHGAAEAAVVLVTHGAALDVTDGDRRAPLHVAAMEGQTKVVEAMLARGAGVDDRDTYRATSSAPHAMGLGLREMLIGQDPLQVEAHWERLYVGSAMNGRRGAVIHALGALDIAPRPPRRGARPALPRAARRIPRGSRRPLCLPATGRL